MDNLIIPILITVVAWFLYVGIEAFIFFKRKRRMKLWREKNPRVDNTDLNNILKQSTKETNEMPEEKV